MTIIVFLLLQTDTHAAGQWSVYASMQATKGNYIFATTTNSYYLYGGLRYRANRWNVSASLPIIAQNNDLVTQLSGMLMPTGVEHHEGSGSASSNHGDMMGESGSPILTMGLGDLYLLGEYQLVRNYFNGFVLAAKTQVKLPTANMQKNYGTGKVDYGIGLSVRQRFGTFMGLVDLGYLVLGDPAEVKFRDPITFAAGIGKYFWQGDLSALLFYQRYSEILANYDAPQQLSFGMSYRTSSRLVLTGSLLAGLSNTTPDFSFLTGLEWQF